MATVTFRFYEELNDFLPEHMKKVDIESEFYGKKSIKDIILGFGVPPSKVDLILINENSVDFNYIVQDGDRASVYPVFEAFNIQNVSRLRKCPLRRIRFIADNHLKDMVQSMRLLGFDIDFNGSYTTQDIIEKSIQEKRIILTKRKNLFESETITHCLIVRQKTILDQVKFVIDKLDINDRIKPFSRCLCCNDLLENRQRKPIPEKMFPETQCTVEKHLLCDSCCKKDRRKYTCQLNVRVNTFDCGAA